MDIQPETTRRRKNLRAFLVVGVTVLATAAIGFGGLAAWSVTTQNNGNSFASGSIHHSNSANLNGAGTLTNCTDTTSPGACGVVFNLANAEPGSTISGSVKITNTGTLNSTFFLAPGTGANAITVSPNTSDLCTNLNLSIVDQNAVSVYNGSLATFAATGSLKQSLGSTTWAPTNSNTFTFTVTLPSGDTDLTDMSASCTAGFTWTQTDA